MAIVCTSPLAIAQIVTVDNTCKPAVQHIFTINGVLADRSMAQDNLKRLINTLSADPDFNQLTKSTTVDFDFIYNDTGGAVDDFVESVRQKWNAIYVDVLVLYYGTILKDFDAYHRVAEGLGTMADVQNPTPVDVANRIRIAEVKLAEFRTRVVQDNSNEAINRITIVDGPRLAKMIKKGDFVLLVAHSQGNFFARELRDAVVAELGSQDEINRLTVLNVASPTGVPTNNVGILQLDDLVISSIPGAHVTTFVPNTGNDSATLNNALFGDMLGHNFIKVYLNNTVEMSPQRKTLQRQLIEAARGLINNFNPNLYCVVVSPEATSLTIGGSRQLTASLKLNGKVLSQQPIFSWSSSNPSVASVSTDGLVNGVAEGSATAYAENLLSHALGTSQVQVSNTCRPSFSGISFVSRTNDIGIIYDFSCITQSLAGTGRTVHTYNTSNGAVSDVSEGAFSIPISGLSGPLANQQYAAGGFDTGGGFISMSITATITLPNGEKVTRSAQY
jgi:hypothetical protein